MAAELRILLPDILRGTDFPVAVPVPPMSIIPLTLVVSLCLVFTFVVFFLRENARRFSSAERDSLLPLADETPRHARATIASTEAVHLSDPR